MSTIPPPPVHAGATRRRSPREQSTCGWRDRLISREDEQVAAWAHAVDIEEAKPHYHKHATELYYVLEGAGVVLLDGTEHPVRKGSSCISPRSRTRARQNARPRRRHPQHRRRRPLFPRTSRIDGLC
ncbi:MAG: cupin domain-containing protein [Planctomycetaceae bacterium]